MIQARGASDPSTAREHNILGTIYARFGLFGEAQAQFEHAVGLADYVPAIINLASVSGLLGDHDTARELLGRANDLAPDNPRILLGLAVEHLEDGQRGSARGFYDQVAVLDPRLAQAYPLFGGAGATSDAGAARASDGDTLQDFRMGAWAE